MRKTQGNTRGQDWRGQGSQATTRVQRRRSLKLYATWGQLGSCSGAPSTNPRASDGCLGISGAMNIQWCMYVKLGCCCHDPLAPHHNAAHWGIVGDSIGGGEPAHLKNGCAEGVYQGSDLVAASVAAAAACEPPHDGCKGGLLLVRHGGTVQGVRQREGSTSLACIQKGFPRTWQTLSSTKPTRTLREGARSCSSNNPCCCTAGRPAGRSSDISSSTTTSLNDIARYRVLVTAHQHDVPIGATDGSTACQAETACVHVHSQTTTLKCAINVEEEPHA